MLVGGEGTRLRPLTLTTPKPLLPIANRPFLARQLDWLERHGVTEVVLALGYLPDPFRAAFPEGRHGRVTLRYAVEPEPLGTGGAIRFAAASFDERFVVCNGDVLTALDLHALVAFHEVHRAEASIHLTRVDEPSAFGVVPTYDDAEVRAFVEKPRGRAPSEWINAGTYVLEPSVLDRIPTNRVVSVERETFPLVLEERGRLYAMQSDAYWIDIGTPQTYLEANCSVLEGVLATPGPGDGRELAPGVLAHGEVVVDPGAIVIAPALLGPGVRVDGGARVERSVLGASSHVGARAVVEGSVLLDDARVERGARVVGAVVGPHGVVEWSA